MNRRNFLYLASASGAAVVGGQPAGFAASPVIRQDAGGIRAHRGPVPNRRIIRVASTRDDRTSQFALDELVRCLRTITAGTVVSLASRQFEPAADTIWIGCLEDFPGVPAADVADPERDDAIDIRVESRRGIISGANPRATLIATYRYLSELGCRWVRPGRDNEMFPLIRDPLSRTVRVREKPAARHRGLSIEGACSCEHVVDFVDWLPKVGMNTGMIEYTNAFIYYNNWYSRRQDPANSTRLMEDIRATELADHAVDEMKRRGLMVHRMGHGWGCFVLGIPSELWDEPITRDFGDLSRFIALFEGKRQLFRGIPRRTQLCYSQPEVRIRLAREVVKYAAAHPQVDYIHYWLGDGANHCCECEDCRKARPSDFYVMTLNEIDRLLTEQNLPNRIAFLAYADLLWPPETERIKNPDRFVLMFATLARSYFEPFDPEGLKEPVPPFVLNKLQFSSNQNLNFLAGWQKVFKGDSFIYDYRFMWAHYDDPGYMLLAQATALDMPSLAAVGLNGIVSNQSERVFVPSGLPMTVMARRLWDHDLPYESIVEDYFNSAFGRDGGLCRAYLEALTQSFDPRWISTFVPGKGTTIPPGAAQQIRQSREAPPGTVQRLAHCRRLVEEFRPVIERNRNLSDPIHERSWRYLVLHADVCDLLAQALEAEVRDRPDEAHGLWQKLDLVVNSREGEYHEAFDVFLFLISLKKRRAFNPLPSHQLED
jgi:hypothetical protein